MSSLIQKTKISKKKEGGFMLVGLRVDHRLLQIQQLLMIILEKQLLKWQSQQGQN